MTELETAVDQLQAVALEDFVGERKRLAKELRGAGEREAAAELAKLPKPTAPAWALNHVAREQPKLVAEWLVAADALRDASSTGDDLRAAITAHREATRGLLATVRGDARPNGRALTQPMLDRARELLQAATADPALAERLRAGRVVEGAAEATEEPAAAKPGAATKRGAKSRAADEGTATKRDAKSRAADEGAATKRGAKSGAADGGAATKRAAKPAAASDRDSKRTLAERAATKSAQREAEARAELERLAGEAEARVAELREAASGTETAAAQAEERFEEATRTLHRSESEADAARQAADEAAEALQHAERELRKLTAKLSS